MHHSNEQPSASNILLITGGIIFFGGVLVILGFRLYALHYRRQEPELQGAHSSVDRRTYLRRLSVLMFGDSRLPLQDLPAPQEQKSAFGLAASVFEGLPTFIFKQGSEKSGSKEEIECSVCLEDFAEGEKGRILPECGHCFHADCVDMWFFSHTTCPICRSDVEKPLASLPRISSDAGPPESTTTDNGPQNRFNP